MFCPRCGSPTEERDGRLYCVESGMDFSPVVATELAKIAGTPPEEPEPSTVHWGSRWRCPVDAESMVEHDGHVSCPRCSRALPPLLMHQLVELHVHPPMGDG